MSETHPEKSSVRSGSPPGMWLGSSAGSSLMLEVLFAATALIVLVACGVGGHHQAQVNKIKRLRVATESLSAEAGAQRDLLVSAIRAYKEAFGSYPPDHVICRDPVAVDPVTNALLYELLGTFHDVTNDTFSAGALPGVRAELLGKSFGLDSIRNSSVSVQGVRRFLNPTNVLTVYPITRSPDPVGLLGIWPRAPTMGSDLYPCFDVVSWRYNSSAPTHNLGGFDLWLEIRTPQTNILVKNW